MQELRLLITLASALALSACVIAPYPYQYARQPVYYPPAAVDPTVVVDVAPPPPFAEVVPVTPFLDAFWIAGFWGWSGGRHMWVPGRWEHQRAGYGWQPHAWVQQGGRWHLHAGGWVRR